MSINQLKRDIGLGGAILMGLGSIVGTGVFVSLAVAGGAAGSQILLAIFVASIVATCNGISSAQLAANHPVSGGTYEYGHRWLNPTVGFVAGWLFLCAKSASAATAALGLAAYVQWALGLEGIGIRVAVALGMLLLLTLAVIVGIKRTNRVNLVIVGTTLFTLAIFVFFGLPTAIENASDEFSGPFQFDKGNWNGFLYGTALMFVAYTGYGRIATLGEEVKEPRKTIPRAMVLTLMASMALYLSVGFVAFAVMGVEELSETISGRAAPLVVASEQIQPGWVSTMVFVGAITAMAGVLLNLLLGLSRVALAMGRRSDLPKNLSQIDKRGVPFWATWFIVLMIGILVLIGNIEIAWSFSAFTVLIYYAITNLCALRVEKDSRVFPVWPSWIGLVGCTGLIFWIEPSIFIAGIIVIIVGLLLRMYFRSAGGPENSNQ